MKRTLVYASVVAAGLGLMSAPARAHHGDAGRYEEKLTTVTGTLVELQLVSPHTMLILDVKDGAGKVVRWRGEAGGVAQLARWGWKKDTIKTGETITMTGRRAKNGSAFMTLSEGARVVDAHGKELFRASTDAQRAPSNVEGRGNDPGQPSAAGRL